MNPPSKSVIDTEAFKQIIKAMHLIEAKHELINKSASENNLSLKSDYDSLLNAHSITEELFIESINHYTNNPYKLNSVYTSILEELKKEKETLP
tara:strand:+ start:168 stop:449 length:282 start_codon:yes stop_codon:yes gene_type:complete